MALAAVFPAGSAQAHTALQDLGSFWSGVVHFLISFDRLGLVFALAVWAGVQRRRSDAAIVAIIAVSAFLAATALGLNGGDNAAPRFAAAAMVLIGAAGAATFDIGAAPILAAAACCGALGGAIGASGSSTQQLALNALGLSLAAAAIAAYTLVAASFSSSPRYVTMGLRLGAAAVAVAGVALLSVSEYSRFFGRG